MAQTGTEERKTSTILAMDVARYSQLMGIDEGTLKQLKACREIIETKVFEAKGRIFNTAGDALWWSFPTLLVLLTLLLPYKNKFQNITKRLLIHQKDFISAWALI